VVKKVLQGKKIKNQKPSHILMRI